MQWLLGAEGQGGREKEPRTEGNEISGSADGDWDLWLGVWKWEWPSVMNTEWTTASYKKESAYHLGITPEPGENLWIPQLSLKSRKHDMVVLSLGAERGTETKGGADSGARQEPPAGLWRGWCGVLREHRGTTCSPKRGSWSQAASCSRPQPMAQEVCTGRHWAGFEFSEAVPGTQPGTDTKAVKTQEGKARKDPLFLPTSPRLFRTPGQIRCVEILRKLFSY